MAPNENKIRLCVEFLFKRVDYRIARVITYGLTERQLRSRYLRISTKQMRADDSLFSTSALESWKRSRKVGSLKSADLYIPLAYDFVKNMDKGYTFTDYDVAKWGMSVKSDVSSILDWKIINFKAMSESINKPVSALVYGYLAYLFENNINIKGVLADYNRAVETAESDFYYATKLPDKFNSKADLTVLTPCFEACTVVAKYLNNFTGIFSVNEESYTAARFIVLNNALLTALSEIANSNESYVCNDYCTWNYPFTFFAEGDVRNLFLSYLFNQEISVNTVIMEFSKLSVSELESVLKDSLFVLYLIYRHLSRFYYQTNGYTEYGVLMQKLGGEAVMLNLENLCKEYNYALYDNVLSFEEELNKQVENINVLQTTKNTAKSPATKQAIKDFSHLLLSVRVPGYQIAGAYIYDKYIQVNSIPDENNDLMLDLTIMGIDDAHMDWALKSLEDADSNNSADDSVVACESGNSNTSGDGSRSIAADKAIKKVLGDTNNSAVGTTSVTAENKTDRAIQNAISMDVKNNNTTVSKYTEDSMGKTKNKRINNASNNKIKANDATISKTQAENVSVSVDASTPVSASASAPIPVLEPVAVAVNAPIPVSEPVAVAVNAPVNKSVVESGVDIFAEQSVPWTVLELCFLIMFGTANLTFDLYVKELKNHSYTECQRKYDELHSLGFTDMASIIFYTAKLAK